MARPHIITNWPLQIYSSTVIFSPESSVTKRENLDKIPGWLRNISSMEDTWASLVQTMAGHSSMVIAVAFSPDGKQVASSLWDMTIKLWDATTGDCQKILAGHSSQVTAVAFSPDGKQIASSSDDKTIKLWDAITGNCQKTMAGHSSQVTAVTFSPDGKQIASGSDDGTTKLWDATTGDCQKTLAGHSSQVTAVAFSPDGKQIASGSSDKTIKLWDIAKSPKASKYPGHIFGSRLKLRSSQEVKTSERIHTIKFSGDCRYLTTNIGPIKLVAPADGRKTAFDSVRDIYVINQWICYGDMPLIRIPSEFIPSCDDAQGDQLTVGFSNGRVLSFNIDRSSLQSMMGNLFRLC